MTLQIRAEHWNTDRRARRAVDALARSPRKRLAGFNNPRKLPPGVVVVAAR